MLVVVDERSRLDTDIKKKNVVYETQELSQDDVKRMQDEMKSLKRSVAQQQDEIDRFDKDIGEQEMSLEKRRDKIEALCAEFNNLAASLELLPIQAPNSSGVDYTLVAKPSMSENQKFSSEIKVLNVLCLNNHLAVFK